MRCTVIGAGVVGLTIAFRLAQKGVEVTVLDKGEIGREASWAGAGILPPVNHKDPVHALDRLKALSHQLYPALSAELLELTGIDNEHVRCGGLYLASTIGEAASLIGQSQLWEKEGVEFQKLSQEELVELEPALRSFAEIQMKAAYLLPDEMQLRNPRHLRALLSACEKLGVNVVSNQPVRAIEVRAGQAKLDLERGNSESKVDFTTDKICVASGAWSSQLLGGLSKSQVVPIKGQMLLFRLEDKMFARILNEGNRYIVPRKDGFVLVGSTEEETGFDKSNTDQEQAELLEFARGFLPELTREKLVKSWAGLRPMSFDSFPYIGRHSEIESLFIATGHFRSGLHLAPGTAQLISELILDEDPLFDISDLRPER